MQSGQGFKCDNHFGDPAYGSGKQCKIDYKLGPGASKTLLIGEGGYFDPNVVPFN
jgi:hypothetical protein